MIEPFLLFGHPYLKLRISHEKKKIPPSVSGENERFPIPSNLVPLSHPPNVLRFYINTVNNAD